MKARAVVFDLDGVLLESGDIKTAAFLELFAAHPEHLFAIERHHLANLGLSRFKKFAWIHERLGLPFDDATSARLGAAFSALVFQKVCEAPFVPGALEALEALMSANMPMALASGTPQEELDRIVDVRGLRRCFGEVSGAPTEKADVILRTMARVGCAPGELLFVGDGTNDHDAARATGVRFLARRTPALADHWRNAGVACIDDLRGLTSDV